MTDFSFNIKISKDFFAKLLADYEDFVTDKTVSRTALNCTITTWHLLPGFIMSSDIITTSF